MSGAIEVQNLGIACVKLIKTHKFGDRRGFFSETYSRRDFSEAGINIDFVQDNHSLPAAVHTVRGLHFQLPPFAQDKLVRVIRGAIFDVAVDLRSRSPTYGKYVSTVISADEWNQILVPIGFAHGFMTLEPDTEVIYKSVIITPLSMIEGFCGAIAILLLIGQAGLKPIFQTRTKSCQLFATFPKSFNEYCR